MRRKYCKTIVLLIVLLTMCSCKNGKNVEDDSSSSTVSVAQTIEDIEQSSITDIGQVRILNVNGNEDEIPSSVSVYRIRICDNSDDNRRCSISNIEDGIQVTQYTLPFYTGGAYENNNDIPYETIKQEDLRCFTDSIHVGNSEEGQITIESEYESVYLIFRLPYYSDFISLTFGDDGAEIATGVELSCVFVRQSVEDLPIGMPYIYQTDTNYDYVWNEDIRGIAHPEASVSPQYYVSDSIYIVDNLEYDLEPVESDVGIIPFEECVDGINESINRMNVDNHLYDITPYAAELCYVPILSFDSGGVVTDENGLEVYYLVPCWVVYYQNNIDGNSNTRFAGTVIVNASTGQMMME